MANREIYTTPLRCSFPHLAKPYVNKQKPEDPAKFMISLMAPFTGQCALTNPPTPASFENIKLALNEVCMEEWNTTYEQAVMPGMGINFPPNFKNGNTVFEKDAQGNPIAGQVSPYTKDMEILTVKSDTPVGCVDPTNSVEINPASIYGGCWVCCNLEVSAYTNNNGNRVLAVKLIHVQMAYNDTPFGNKAPTKTATQAFQGRAITNSNVEAGFGQQGAAGMPAIAPQTVQSTAPPPQTQPTPEMKVINPVIMNAGEASLEAHLASGWSEQQLVDAGKATRPAAVQTPPATVQAPPQATPAMVQQGNVQSAPPATVQQQVATVGAPPNTAPAAAPSVNAPAPAPTTPVIMNAGEPSYEEYVAMGWTAEMLIQHGKAQPNMLQPAV